MYHVVNADAIYLSFRSHGLPIPPPGPYSFHIRSSLQSFLSCTFLSLRFASRRVPVVFQFVLMIREAAVESLQRLFTVDWPRQELGQYVGLAMV